MALFISIMQFSDKSLARCIHLYNWQKSVMTKTKNMEPNAAL